MSEFICENFSALPEEVHTDFFSCFTEAAEEIEECCALLDNRHDADEIHAMFRAMHSLKGNCRMVFLDPLVDLCHQLEEIVSDMRSGQYDYHPLLGEFITGAIRRLESFVGQLITHGTASQSLLDLLSETTLLVYKADNERRTAIYDQALDRLAGVKDVVDVAQSQIVPSETDQQQLDLDYFYNLACRMDALGPYPPNGVSDAIQVCSEVNKQLGSPVDSAQLKAAVCLHDVGLMFMPASFRSLNVELSRQEQNLFREHTQLGAELLSRMPGWEVAAEIVAQHHERHDGKGYPVGLQGAEIHTGAQILAVVDTYQKVIYQHSDTSFRKTLLRAVTEVNSNSGMRFDPKVVDAFNLVVRQRFIKQREGA